MNPQHVKTAAHLKDNLTVWKTNFEGSEYLESTIKVSNAIDKDITIFYRHISQKAPKACVFIFHGLTESSQFYGSIASNLSSQNIEVFAADHQGSGKSHGNQNHEVNDYNALYQNGWSFVFKMVAANYDRLKETPIFFLGTSMGAATIMEMLLNIPKNFKGVLTGCVLLSPSILLLNRPPLEGLLRISSYILPTFSARTIPPEDHSGVPEVQEIYKTNPEKYLYIPSTVGREIISMADHLVNNLDKIKLPTLLMQGTDDRVVDKKGAQLFSDKNRIEDFTYTEYVGSSHILLQDWVALEVEAKILDWIKKRSK
jgi:acylglycerol lipase